MQCGCNCCTLQSDCDMLQLSTNPPVIGGMGVLNALCRYAIAGPSVVTRTGVLQDHVVIVCDERIEAIVPSSQLPAEIDVQRMDGAYLVPGFIDLHVHGAAGRSYNEGTEEAITEIGTTILKAGVTKA